jgi:hypothetical protein
MTRDKKAQTSYKAVVAVILVIFLIICGLVLSRSLIKETDAVGRRDICKKSIEFNGVKLNGLADQFGNPVDLKCETEYINFKEQDDEAIQKEVADQMVDCWDLYGRGQLELFDTKDNTYCVVCSRLSFTKKTEIPHFSVFLNTNIAPYKQETYMEYFTGLKVDNFQQTVYENSDLSGYDNLSTKEPLAVMFVMGKDAYPGGLAGGTQLVTTPTGLAVGSAAGVVVGAILVVAGVVACPVGCFLVAGAIAATGGGIGYLVGSDRSADWDARVMLWPYDKLNELPCTSLESSTGHLQVRQE